MSKVQTSEELMALWNPNLVREAGEIAVKLPRDQMKTIMVQATEFLDTLPWKGIRRHERQELSWPRMGVLLEDGEVLSHGIVPEEVKECSIKVSYFIAAGVPFDVPALTHVLLTVGHLLSKDVSLKKDDLTPWAAA